MSIYGNPVMMGGSGGSGGSTNVLSGTTAPTAAQGNNGTMYLQYSDAGLKNATGQYINTGYSGKDNSRYVIDFMLSEGQTIKYPTPFGARSAPSAVNNASYLHLGNGSNYTSGYVAWGNYQETTSLGASAIIGKRTIIELSKSAYAYTVDGQRTEIPITGGTVTDTTPIGIFSAICNGSLLQDVGISGMVLYSFAIYESDTLVHRYVPALDSNDVACVYDEVTSQYIYHSGGGTLEYIPEGSISDTYAKVNGTWQELIGTDINDIDLGGGGGTFNGTLIGTYTDNAQGGIWYNTGHDTTNDSEFVVAYCYQGVIKKIITVSKSDVESPPNGSFINVGAELNSAGSYITASGFSLRITNNILNVSFNASGSGLYSAKVYSSTNAEAFFAPLFSS